MIRVEEKRKRKRQNKRGGSQLNGHEFRNDGLFAVDVLQYPQQRRYLLLLLLKSNPARRLDCFEDLLLILEMWEGGR